MTDQPRSSLGNAAPGGHSLRIENLTRGTALAVRAGLAATFWTRLVGLLGRAGLAEGEGLFIRACTMIHMFGMRFAIDVVFVDADLVVVGLEERIAPGRMSRHYPKAAGVIELPVGIIAATGTALGDQLAIS